MTRLALFDNPKTLFAAIILVTGIAMTGYGAYDYTQQSDALADAVTVSATVTDTSVETVHQRRDIDYRPVITYNYTVDGTQYQSNDYSPSMSTVTFDSESNAQDIAGNYTVGETVTAYVDPDTPSDAFLDHERSDDPLTFLGIGGVTVVVGGVGIVRRLL